MTKTPKLDYLLRYCAISWKTAQPAEEAHAELIKILRDLDKAREIICQMEYAGKNAREYLDERVAEETEAINGLIK